ncbi:MAG: GTP-binding protein [Oscillospiraceae bacterium]|nr:GTP-binding protein [Oscillospiraceae bacterium]
MTTIDIFSGFLGAGKTTLIKKLIAEGYQNEKLVLIENEFGEIGIDGGFLKDAGVAVTEMNSGCICCSLVGDFGKALEKVLQEYHPDRIIIEPSGVGKLSDVIAAVQKLTSDEVQLGSFVAVADAGKTKLYMKNFGEFYNNQLENASAIILSRTQSLTQDKLEAAVELVRTKNPHATIITTPWDDLTGEQILAALKPGQTMAETLLEETKHAHEGTCGCGHHDHDHEHHHDDHGCCHGHHEEDDNCCGHHHGEDEQHFHEGTCGCGHHDHEHEHHHDDHECCHGHHEEDDNCCGHHHGEDEQHSHEGTCGCGHHDQEHEHGEHHHEHGESCTCGCHDEGHHHADEVFTSWGFESPRKYTKAELEFCLNALDEGVYGMVLRAKGIVPAADGTWLHFDYVPAEYEVRTGAADVTGRLCVIGADLKQEALAQLFKKEC